MFAQLEYEFGRTTCLVLYRSARHAKSDEPYLLSIELDNEQLTELVVSERIKPVNKTP